MIDVQIGSIKISVRDDLLGRSKTLRLIGKATEKTWEIYPLLDRLIDGGSELVERLLDPVDADPTDEQLGDFVEKLFNAIGELKNSQGSRSLSDSASQRLEPTYKDTIQSTSMTYTPSESV